MNAERPDLAPLIDHAQLDPLAGRDAIERCCDEARHFGFAGVCVASRWVAHARERLPRNSGGPLPRLVSVIGFPFGAVAATIKRSEAELAAEQGADELDVVPDFGALTDRDSTRLHADLAAVAEVGLPFKVILEAGKLTPEALELLVEVSIDAGASFLKTGSGFGPAAVKASGGIANLESALELVTAGATRLGTSRGVALIEALRSGA